jgi:hypothetical protein
VRPLVALPASPVDADVQGVEAFDGGIQKHGFREAEVLLEGKEEIEHPSSLASVAGRVEEDRAFFR